MKCTIFVNRSHTTSITLYPWASGSLVMKSAVICIQGFSGALFGISFPAGAAAQFLFRWQESQSSTYLFTFFVTPGHQKFLVTNSTVFHCPPCPPTGVSWCSRIISVLNSSSFNTYTFPSFNIRPSFSLYSSSLSIFTPACFISSTVLMTLSSFTFDSLTFFNKSTSSINTSSTLVLLSHSAFTSVLSSLSLSIPFLQSGLLLSPFAFPILLPGTYFNKKSNLDRNNAHFAYRLFNFWFVMKYSKFLWSVQILNLVLAPSRKCLHASKHLITANISLL